MGLLSGVPPMPLSSNGGRKDEVKTCALEAKRPNQEDNPMTRQIRILENR